MKDSILPIFSTHASIGSSILTSEYDGKKADIDELSPVSVIDIANQYNIENTYIADSSISLFIQCCENFKKAGRKFTWGLKLAICNDAKDKSEESLKTESKVIIWMKNSDSYKDLVKIYTKAHVDDFYYRGRTDWPTLKSLWSDNLLLSIPFYGGFIHNNFFHGHSSLPDFNFTSPYFFINKMGMPYDSMLESLIVDYTKANKIKSCKTHPVYYYKENDFDAYCVFRCIHDREKFGSPNINNFFSNKFSFESYLKNEQSIKI